MNGRRINIIKETLLKILGFVCTVIVYALMLFAYVVEDEGARERIAEYIAYWIREKQVKPSRGSNPPAAVEKRLAAVEEGYVKIGYSTNGRYGYYFSPSSIEKREQDGNEYITGWIQVIIMHPDQEEPINGEIPGFYLELWAANPKVKQIQILSEATFTPRRGPITHKSHSFGTDRWLNCGPGSAHEVYWNKIMAAYTNPRR